MDWSQVPDLAAILLLASAFASLARQGRSSVSALWLTGWLLIALHFAAFVFLPIPGRWGDVAQFVGLAALADAGVLFMYSAVPYREQQSTRFMLLALLASTTIYLAFLLASPSFGWALTIASVLIGVSPLALAIIAAPAFRHPLRALLVCLYGALAIYLLTFQHRKGDGADLALNGLLCAVYLGCCLHFWYTYRKATAGALITIVGFAAWSLVFVIGPILFAYLPGLKVESEVWNLPKYLVAVGMILLLLEEQIEHNKFLALHDELTGLPNRRLFSDRLTVAIGRSERQGSSLSLLVVDLDRFKEVNDTLGHHAGDEVLKLIARTLEGRVRRCDTVARTGGDEFSIVLEETRDSLSAHKVAESLLNLIALPMDVDGRKVQVGASIGIASFPEDARNLEALCIVADRRMYDKKGGYRSASPREDEASTRFDSCCPTSSPEDP